MRQIFRTKSGKVALGGILAAGSLATMMLAGVLPLWKSGLVALTGLFPIVGVLIAGRAVGYFCWFTVGILGIILLPDKGIALLYLLFFGLYPVLKEQIESIRRLPVEWIIKFIFFNLIFSIFCVFFQYLFLSELSGLYLNKKGFLYLLGNGMFVCYDILLSRVVAILCNYLK